MSGRLGYDDNPGGGSIFWLELPQGDVDEAMSEIPLAAAVKDSQKPEPALRVLVVDDVAMNRDIACAFLTAAGYQVTCADSGKEAIMAAGNTEFDVILMDVRMPGMDGLEATRQIRALGGPHRDVSIVALTAQAFTEQVSACRAAGMDSHLCKPYDQSALISAVTQAAGARLISASLQFGPA